MRVITPASRQIVVARAERILRNLERLQASGRIPDEFNEPGMNEVRDSLDAVRDILVEVNPL